MYGTKKHRYDRSRMMKKQLTKKQKQQQSKIDSARVIFAGIIIFVVTVFLFVGVKAFTSYGDNYIYEKVENEDWFDYEEYTLN